MQGGTRTGGSGQVSTFEEGRLSAREPCGHLPSGKNPGKPGPRPPPSTPLSLSHLTLSPLSQLQFAHLLAWLRLHCEIEGTQRPGW